jgi:hypothetical protein
MRRACACREEERKELVWKNLLRGNTAGGSPAATHPLKNSTRSLKLVTHPATWRCQHTQGTFG